MATKTNRIEMRIRMRDLFLAFALSVISPCGILMVQGQDTSFPGTEMDEVGVDKETEKMMYSPGELDPAFKKSQAGAIAKDSAGIKAVLRPTKVQSPDSSKTPVKRPAQDDDSILSFNFLYYIFQKYKMQDMVD